MFSVSIVDRIHVEEETVLELDSGLLVTCRLQRVDFSSPVSHERFRTLGGYGRDPVTYSEIESVCPNFTVSSLNHCCIRPEING